MKIIKLKPRLRELLIIGIGWATGVVYEWTQHWRVATQMDISEADLLAVRNWQDSELLSDEDKAILHATDDVFQNEFISRLIWPECCKYIPSEAEQIELAIGYWLLGYVLPITENREHSLGRRR